MAKKLGFFLILLNVVMAIYVFYLRPLWEIDPLPEKNQIYPERIQIIKSVEPEAEAIDNKGADGSI
ncbi:MAG: hypothetical protein O3A56_06415 [Proteobacteria bacterium]|nr:hypothetical protein [Pseudomonadota bacterium]MDA0861364.1 hypothetical protein [Pseudomonadota bacterium]MDA1031071.1 hypothetical protein [Pseudomonadota bacterium]